MPAKAPIYLKANSGKNGSGNSKGGKKLRELLSSEMISLPLGDFRHMAHVGRGGADDMFGDTTFLNKKNANDTATNDQQRRPQDEATPQLQNMRSRANASKKQRNNSVPDSSQSKQEAKSSSNRSCDGYDPLESPILQSAFSLPLLHQQSASTPSSPAKDEQAKASMSKVNNKKTNQMKATSHETGLDNLASTPNGVNNGPPKPRRLTVEDDVTANGHTGRPMHQEKPIETAPQTTLEKTPDASSSDTTSIDEGWALELDLGTSLMDDVMGVMEKIEL